MTATDPLQRCPRDPPTGDRGVQTQWEKPTYREGQIPPGIQTRREKPTYRKGQISPGVQTRREKPTYREGLMSPGVQTQREKTTYTEGQKSPGVRTGRPEPESWCREHRFHSFTFLQKRCQNYLQNASFASLGELKNHTFDPPTPPKEPRASPKEPRALPGPPSRCLGEASCIISDSPRRPKSVQNNQK